MTIYGVIRPTPCAGILLHECVGLFVVIKEVIGREDWKGGKEGKEKGRERREGEGERREGGREDGRMGGREGG